MNTNSKFKDMWIDAVMRKLNITDDSIKKEMEGKYDAAFRDNSLHLNNSVYNTKRTVKATDYFLTAGEKCIINENGVLTYKHSVKSDKMYDVIDGGIKGRQVQKKKKQNFIKEHLMSEAEIIAYFEYALKVLINGLYGLHLYPGSAFYNITLGATCTAAARNLVAVAAVVIELMEGGFRNYQVQAHIKMVECTRVNSSEISTKYNLKDVTVEEVLKVLLGDYYEGYYALTFLRSYLEKESQYTLNTLYIKNNIYGFMDIPIVSDVMNKVINIYNDTKIPLVDPKKDEAYKETMKQLYDMSYELIYGFYYYDGDYDGTTGVYYDTLVDIVENIKRKKIVLMDTDSCVTTLQREVEYCLDKYESLTDRTDDVLTNATIPMMIVWIYMGCLDNGLTNYVKDLGVEDEQAQTVKIEMEHMMEQLHITIAKKSYGYIPTITDFYMNDGKKLKLKGVSIIKSNFNKEFCGIAEEIVKKKIMVDPSKLIFKDIITDIKKGTDEAIRIVKSDDFILNKRTTLKIGKEGLSFSEHKMKSVNLWNKLFPEDRIEFPGSFGVILLSLDDRKLKVMEAKHNREYEILKSFAISVGRFRKIMTLHKKMNGVLPRMTPTINQIQRVTAEVANSNSYLETAWNILVKIFKDLSDIDKEIFKEMKVKNVFIEEPDFNNIIVENIDKLALPLDLNVVPSFIKEDDYSIMDINASGEVEHVISPFTSTMGIMFSKNNENKNTITSVLNIF